MNHNSSLDVYKSCWFGRDSRVILEFSILDCSSTAIDQIFWTWHFSKNLWQGSVTFKSACGCYKYIHVIPSIISVTQPAFTCSKLTKETLEQCVKYVRKKQRHQNDGNVVKVNKKDTRTTPMFTVNDANGVILVSLLLTSIIFHLLFWCF